MYKIKHHRLSTYLTKPLHRAMSAYIHSLTNRSNSYYGKQMDDVRHAIHVLETEGKRTTESNIALYTNYSLRQVHFLWIYRDILSYHKLGNGIGNKMDLNRILNHPQRFLFDSRFFKTDGSLKQLMHVAATLPDGKWKRSKAMDSVEDMFYLFKKLEDKNPVDTLKILESFGRYKIFLHDYAEYRNMSPGELYFYWNSYKADAEKHNDWKEWDAYVRKHKIILQEQLRKHDGIALSTLHRSKGLEWDRVYILNCVKNTIPFAKQGTVEDLEEERRLFYVGCTRAKKELQLLSYQGNSGEISPFIKELKSSESDTGDKVDLDVHLKY